MTWAEFKTQERQTRATWIRSELQASNWNVSACARRTGIERTHLYKMMKALKLTPPENTIRPAGRGNELWQGLRL